MFILILYTHLEEICEVKCEFTIWKKHCNMILFSMVPIYPISYHTIQYRTHQPTQLLLYTTREVTDIIPYLLSVHRKFCGWVVLGGGSEESGREIFYWKSKDGCLSSNKSLLSKLNIDSTDVQKTWAVCSFCLLVKS